MTEPQLAAERAAAFTAWWKPRIVARDDGLVSPSLREAFEGGAAWQAALAQREPVADGEVAEVISRLGGLYDAKRPAGGVHGQIIGMEPYVLKANGEDFQTLLDAIYALQRTEAARLAVEEQLAHAKREAESLAMALWRNHYRTDSPNFGLCDTVAGVITQIDNMAAGLAQDLTAERARSEKLVESLQSISEYWNRDRNDMAMHNACWHAINTSEEALAAYVDKD